MKQWISIRGLNRANPVLLFIHGGPGYPTMPMSWAFQKPWEDFFTVVQWDQRGVGKNWANAHHKTLAPTITLEQLVADAQDVVAYLRQKLHKDKVVVMGWSYGTSIGIQLATVRPEWVSVYVGIGQTTASAESEAYIYRQLVHIATTRGDSQALSELQGIQPYPNPAIRNDGAHIDLVRKWVRAFNGGWYGHRDLDLFSHLQSFTPEYNQQDANTLDYSCEWFINALAKNGEKDDPFPQPVVLKMPAVFMMGRYDLQTPFIKARELFERLQSPHKEFVTFQRSAHFVMFEQPGLVLKTLLDDVLPYTEGTAQFKELPDAPK